MEWKRMRRGAGTTSMNTVSEQMQSFIHRGANSWAKTFSRDAFSTASRTIPHTDHSTLKMVTEEGNLRNIFRVSREKKAGKIAAKASLCAAWRHSCNDFA